MMTIQRAARRAKGLVEKHPQEAKGVAEATPFSPLESRDVRRVSAAPPIGRIKKS